MPTITPLLYRPDYEQIAADEGGTTRELAEVMLEIAQKVAEDEGHAYRPVHAKSHGLLQAELQVRPGLPPALAQGLFALQAPSPVFMRFSTMPGDLLADSVSTPRGVALKVASAQGVQDFLMVNGPAFNAASAKQFLASLKLLAATTDRVPALKAALSAALRGAEALIEKAGGKSPALTALGGQPATHILGETFFTQVPVLYGPYMAKLSLAPASPQLEALRNAEVDVTARPDVLREEVRAFFLEHGGTWALRAQLCTDIEAMPIEDPTVPWPEEQSPYVTVAHIVALPQDAWNESRAAAVDDGMSFSPWHALPEHRPLGSIMRVRRMVYEAAAQFRMAHNGCPMHAPDRPLPG